MVWYRPACVLDTECGCFSCFLIAYVPLLPPGPPMAYRHVERSKRRSTPEEGTPMQYLLLIYFGEAWEQLSLAARQQIYEEQLQLAHQLTASGQYLAGAPLHPPSTATRVQVRDGKQFVTDGPFAETREQLGGYLLIDVTALDEALAIAARGAVARVGTVEVRRIREGPPT